MSTLKAISSMATRHVLAELVAAAHEAGHPDVEIESVGGVDAADRVAAGEAFDLVFLAQGALNKLADAGHVEKSTVAPLLLSQVAVAVPSDSTDPAARPSGTAYGSADGVRDALRAAKRIGYSTGPSGTALVKMIDGWGLSDELGDRLVQARPGVPVAKTLAEGEVDLGFQQLSELVGQQGVRILGVLPDDCAINTVFSGAVVAASADPELAGGLLAYLRSGDVAEVKTRHVFGVPSA
ncbi:MAG: substrate-binding domain-containing protein [Microbacterium gubbeenense]|uniref:substrate-binding domain-containing protein n=1 Tax=Microbacterium TaxID=33882 RepID=UPI003F9E957D